MENDKPTLTETDILTLIEKHLKSIRGMLQFFTVVLILAIVLQACNTLLTL